MRKLIDLEEASELILKHINSIAQETIDLKRALNRTLSIDVIAPLDFPPFNRSAFDGFALRSTDIASASSVHPVRLSIIDEIQAGQISNKIINANQTVKLTTGSAIPEGADIVIGFEDVIAFPDYIDIVQPKKPYSNFCQAGEDIKKGEFVLSKGTVLDPASLGILASLGINQVSVYDTPRISVISTGSELVDINTPLAAAKIYNSNLYTLTSLIENLGGQPVSVGIIDDCPDKIATEIKSQLEHSQMVITTGGVSVGPFDLVKEALIKLGADILFWRVNLRPGTPVLGAYKDGKLILCLSGNPAASFITFQLLGVPAIKKLLGRQDYQLSYVKGFITEDFNKVSNQRRLLRGFGFVDKGVFKINLTGKQTAGIIKSTLNCNVLIDIPAKTQGLQKGDMVDCIFIEK